MVQYATLKKKILQIKLIYQNMNIIYENNVIMIIAIDLQFINQSILKCLFNLNRKNIHIV